MRVIAINAHDNEWPVAVVKIPDGWKSDEAFVKWFKQNSCQKEYAKKNNWTDQQILEEALYAWEEFVVLED